MINWLKLRLVIGKLKFYGLGVSFSLKHFENSMLISVWSYIEELLKGYTVVWNCFTVTWGY